MSARRLPEPIKPRKLVRRRNPIHGFDYFTSDGRYEVYPIYKDRRYGGRSNVVDSWGIRDLRSGEKRAKYYPRLEDIRLYYCAPDGKVPWLVCDMDDGVLRVAESMKAAVEWAASHACAPVRERSHGKGSTCYDYVFGHPGEDSNTCVFIMRADHAVKHGFDPVQQPFYPYPDDPHDPGPRGLGEGAE